MAFKEIVMGKTTGAFYARLFVAGLVFVGGALMLGRADEGEINVAAAIQNSKEHPSSDTPANERGNANPADANAAAIPAAFRDKPNGGLVPQGGSAPAPAPVAEPVSEAASTTEVSADASIAATTTDAGAEGG